MGMRSTRTTRPPPAPAPTGSAADPCVVCFFDGITVVGSARCVVGIVGAVRVGRGTAGAGGGTTTDALAGWKAICVKPPPLPTGPGYSRALTVTAVTWREPPLVPA